MTTYSETTPNKDMLNNEIARRAHELFIRRGCEPGHDLDDWLQAESELRGPARSASEDWREDLRKPSPHDASVDSSPKPIQVEPKRGPRTSS
jgi:DUF2934 family protein